MAHTDEFINSIKDACIEEMNKYGILASISISQAILESGWGKSELAKTSNNLFGIKSHGWSGESYNIRTREVYNGKSTYVNAEFRKYKTLADGIKDRSQFLLKSRYKRVLIAKDYKEAAHELYKAGYATDPKYSSKLIRIIEQYNLYQYDKERGFTMPFKVAVDAGHGINTYGKRTPDGEREWSFNNKVVLAFINELLQYENVEIRRYDDASGQRDIPLSERTNGANAWGADIYISVHHNANTGVWGNWTGTETYHHANSSNGKKLAQLVNDELVKAYGLRNRGLKTNNLHITRETNMTAILTEGCYMDSIIDIQKLRDDNVLRNAGIGMAYAVAKYGRLKRKSTSSNTSTHVHENVNKTKQYDKVNVIYNDKSIEALLINDKTHIWVREIATLVGTPVGYKDGIVYLNGIALDKDDVTIIEDKAYVHVRLVSKICGLIVEWNGNTNTVILSK